MPYDIKQIGLSLPDANKLLQLFSCLPIPADENIIEPDLVNFYRNNQIILQQIEYSKEYMHFYYEQKIREIYAVLKHTGLDILPEDACYYFFEPTIYDVGGHIQSQVFQVPNSDYKIAFGVAKSTSETVLTFYRTAKPASSHNPFHLSFYEQKDLWSFLKTHGVSYTSGLSHYYPMPLHLICMEEHVTAQDFAVQAKPLIHKLLKLHDIEVN